ncbi:dimethylallyltransferase/farnesyldiphosphate synthase IspA [Psychroflexus torquis ATCC 700755]|jgi:geranylgeranyl diphosphate synthase type II|uniref:Dimethylallyltransferase/farnesyldiphosphate synthase IspA n=1 Tax=Psychroflexus torquis (strain ATCC 700755 / CIP 106069 / ACAM 623) TaxID=313595 RepID=K4IJC6_PSYTT|nr:polyprenyl synthetase family protein [Psychroflexus torquis]AFU69206.1 dimethylallyltransferase/farnesyldiphosphate synthase IspA [Psychroflexus torquis ATCC 700755]
MLDLEAYKLSFLEYMEAQVPKKEPRNLYEPIEYILGLGGKRLRPVLVLMSADIFGGGREKAMDAALAIEIFHNFSLVHDDIMDDAPLRRGQQTVHEKWNINTGILSGDAMLINAYQLFENYPAEHFKPLAELFTKTAIEVCEGQQYDVDFEERDDVTIEEYLKMIEYKTAVLVGAALKMGAILSDVSQNVQNKIYEFGRLLGIAFQIQDDYLDTFGEQAVFGKQIGGDIIENKKTYLYLRALELADQSSAEQLKHLYTISPENPSNKIETAKQIFEDSGAGKATTAKIKEYTEIAFGRLDDIEVPQKGKDFLIQFGTNLMNRKM